MRKSIFATALAGILVWAGVASAGPLLPDASTNAAGDFIGVNANTCGGFSCIAGEGAAPNGAIPPNPPTAVQHLDYIVVHDGNVNGGYSYYYQLANTSVATLTILDIVANGFQAAGFIPGVDLGAGIAAGQAVTPGTPASSSPVPAAVKPHAFDPTGVNGFTNLAGVHGDGLPLSGPSQVTVVLGSEAAQFILGLPPGEASGVIVGQGIKPQIVDWNTASSTGPQTWNSINCNPDQGVVVGNDLLGSCAPNPGVEQGLEVLAPQVVPEPGTILLLGSGLAGLGFWGRRRQS